MSLSGFVRYTYREETAAEGNRVAEYGGMLERFWRVLRLKMRYKNRTWNYGLDVIKDHRFLVEVERIF